MLGGNVTSTPIVGDDPVILFLRECRSLQLFEENVLKLHPIEKDIFNIVLEANNFSKFEQLLGNFQSDDPQEFYDKLNEAISFYSSNPFCVNTIKYKNTFVFLLKLFHFGEGLIAVQSLEADVASSQPLDDEALINEYVTIFLSKSKVASELLVQMDSKIKELESHQPVLGDGEMGELSSSQEDSQMLVNLRDGFSKRLAAVSVCENRALARRHGFVMPDMPITPSDNVLFFDPKVDVEVLQTITNGMETEAWFAQFYKLLPCDEMLTQFFPDFRVPTDEDLDVGDEFLSHGNKAFAARIALNQYHDPRDHWAQNMLTGHLHDEPNNSGVQVGLDFYERLVKYLEPDGKVPSLFNLKELCKEALYLFKYLDPAFNRYGLVKSDGLPVLQVLQEKFKQLQENINKEGASREKEWQSFKEGLTVAALEALNDFFNAVLLARRTISAFVHIVAALKHAFQHVGSIEMQHGSGDEDPFSSKLLALKSYYFTQSQSFATLYGLLSYLQCNEGNIVFRNVLAAALDITDAGEFNKIVSSLLPSVNNLCRYFKDATQVSEYLHNCHDLSGLELHRAVSGVSTGDESICGDGSGYVSCGRSRRGSFDGRPPASVQRVRRASAPDIMTPPSTAPKAILFPDPVVGPDAAFGNERLPLPTDANRLKV